MSEARFQHDVKGLAVSPRHFLQDHFIHCQVGYCFAKPRVFLLKILHSLDLARLKFPKLLAPPAVRVMRYADLA